MHDINREAKDASASRSGNPSVIASIEKMIEKIVESLLAKEDIYIELKTKKPPVNSSTSQHGYDVGCNKIRLLGRNNQEAWRFSTPSSKSEPFNMLTRAIAVVFRILELVHEALMGDVVVSKRYLASIAFNKLSKSTFLADT